MYYRNQFVYFETMNAFERTFIFCEIILIKKKEQAPKRPEYVRS